MSLFWLAWITLCTLSVYANTPPKTIHFNDNETVNAVLSSIDMNRIVIDGDQVQNISCPSNFCTISAKKRDQSGAVLLSLSTHVPFVLYVTTKNQKNFGVFVTPQAQPATTTIFKHKSSRLPSFLLPHHRLANQPQVHCCLTTLLTPAAGGLKHLLKFYAPSH